MKKILILLLCLLVSINIASQGKFIDILDGLSIYNKRISTKTIKQEVIKDYFSLIWGKLNFEFKHAEIDDKLCVFINDTDEFLVYLLLPVELLASKMDIPDTTYKYVLLFDKSKSRCYLIKYYPSNTKSLVTYRNIENNIYSMSVSLTGKITFIIELDNNFNPLSAINFILIPPINTERGDVDGGYVYNILKDQILAKKLTLTSTLNIYNASYEEIQHKLSYLKQLRFNEIDSPEWVVDIKKTFISLESGG